METKINTDNLENRLNNMIDEEMDKYFGKEADEIRRNLKEAVRLLIWEYEITAK